MAANYTTIASEESIQVISPTLTQPIIQTTIQTHPSNVIASLALDKLDFTAGTAGAILEPFAANIETIMAQGKAIAAQGSQSLDPNGLIADNVDFVVRYVNPAVPGSELTAIATVPVALLTATESFEGQGGLTAAEAIVDNVYNQLAAL